MFPAVLFRIWKFVDCAWQALENCTYCSNIGQYYLYGPPVCLAISLLIMNKDVLCYVVKVGWTTQLTLFTYSIVLDVDEISEAVCNK